MKSLVDKLSDELSAKYLHYIDVFLVDYCSGDGSVEFNAGFSLRLDHQLRSVSVRLPAGSCRTDIERKLFLRVAFDEIELQIDRAIADDRVNAN